MASDFYPGSINVLKPDAASASGFFIGKSQDFC